MPSIQPMTPLLKPVCGIIRQRTYLPIRYMRLTYALSVVDNANAPIVSVVATYTDALINSAVANTIF